MKDEKMAILSMVEKGIITVDEAERLFTAVDKKGNSEFGQKIGKFFNKAGDSINSLAKTVGEKTEQFVEESKPVVKKAGEKLDKIVEEAKPAMKKAAETVADKAENLKKTYDKKPDTASDFYSNVSENEVEDSDFEEDVTIIPLSTEKTDEDQTNE